MLKCNINNLRPLILKCDIQTLAHKDLQSQALKFGTLRNKMAGDTFV